MKDLLNQKFSFGQFHVDPQANILVRNGEKKKLEPKVIALLCFFAMNAKQAVTRQQINNALWPGVVVGEESITRAIFALRNALGDDAREPKFIETISKKGYRFLVDVTPTLDSKDKITSAWRALFIRPYHLSIFIMAVLVVATTSTFVLKPEPESTFDKILPVTKLIGSEGDMAVHPSGEKMVFVHTVGSETSLLLRTLNDNTEKLINDDKTEKRSPVWVDQETVAYISCASDGCSIVRQFRTQPPEVVYKSEKKILHLNVDKTLPPTLLFTEQQRNESVEVKSLNMGNGARTNLRDTYSDLPLKILSTQFSNDHMSLFFLAIIAEKPVVYKLDLETKRLAPISDSFDVIRHFTIGEDDQLLISGNKGEAQGLWRQSQGGQITLIVRSIGDDQVIKGISADNGKTLYYENFKPNMDTFIQSRHQTNDVRNINSDGCDVNGTFTNNDRDIYFVSNRSGYSEVWRFNRDTSQLSQMTHVLGVFAKNPIVSNDKKSLAVVFRTDKNYLGIIDLETGELIRKKALAKDRIPLSWSSDDQFIYVSEQETNVNLFRYAVADLSDQIVKQGAGLLAIETPNGQSVLTIDYARNGLIEMNINSGSEKLIIDGLHNLEKLMPGAIRLSEDRSILYAIKIDGLGRKLVQYPLQSGDGLPKKLMDLPDKVLVSDINSTGNEVLFVMNPAFSGDIMKLELN